MSKKSSDISFKAVPELSRREALKIMGGTTFLANFPMTFSVSAMHSYVKGEAASGYGKDPDLLNPKSNYWPLTLTNIQKQVMRALVDIVLPSNNGYPSASDNGAVNFLNEWLSAPYPTQKEDRKLILPLIDSLQINQINEDTIKKIEELNAFKRFVALTAISYYSTPIGHEAIGFIGNRPVSTFEGPPEEVLAMLDDAYERL